ncbi:fructosamine kinase [Oceanobacillus piezotolerans]|uniref:Fructosamine kinase n=1 Tax=Oceanobacillus piezotolerans TaxID=2448030 RepID=A0A498D3Y9_9BACI|nr:fructosamine kinase family protein [Oceanobacillus piezotolerans]RLL42679.1 fructosamine kinase [Oceanobacillus piezotolerans]
MKNIIEKGLNQVEKNGEIKSIQPVPGGDINDAYYVRSKQREYFVKLNQQMGKSFFDFEAEGLSIIRNTGTIDVPIVYGVLKDGQTQIPMLWMEWVNGNEKENTETVLGEKLAALHLKEGPGYGYEGRGYIGKLPHENYLSSSWLAYFRKIRLEEQIKLGRTRGTMSGERYIKLMSLLELLDKWIPDKPLSSTLHGDLWGGNWITGEDGKPYLIDPSILYGDHEFEIAFTELFGGFSESFYDTYRSVFPLSPEYEDRKELYQLYYLLVHLNMFGEAYGNAVDRIVKRYVG